MRATIKEGNEKAAEICRLITKRLSLKASDVEHLVYCEDGEVTVAVRVYSKITKRDVVFVTDAMRLAGLTEIKMSKLPDEPDMTAFYSVLKKS